MSYVICLPTWKWKSWPISTPKEWCFDKAARHIGSWFWYLLISALFFFTSATSWIAWMIFIIYIYMIGLWEHLQETFFFFLRDEIWKFHEVSLNQSIYLWLKMCHTPNQRRGVDKFSEFMMINQWILGGFPSHGGFLKQGYTQIIHLRWGFSHIKTIQR